MFYSFRAYQLYFNYLQQSMTRGQKFSKAAHSFKFRTLLIFSIIQPLKSSIILQCTHVFQRIHHWEVFGKVWCPWDLCRKWGAISKLSIILNRQHFTRSRKIASLGSPTKNKDISINASYDNHWCHIVTHPNNKVCVKYDPYVCFIMSTI